MSSDSLQFTPPEDLTRSQTVLRRAGLAVLTDEEFDKKAKIEAQGAMSDLQEMQARIREQQTRCWVQYNATAQEIRAQQERDAISELVTQELERFKEEQRRKEEAEEERLRHLYRGIMGAPVEQPKPIESHYSGYPVHRYNVDPPMAVLEPPVTQPTCAYHSNNFVGQLIPDLDYPNQRPIISSAVNLISEAPKEKISQRLPAFSENPLGMDSSWEFKGRQRLLAPEPSPRRPSPAPRERSSRDGHRSRREVHRSRRPQKPDAEVDEIERLLKLNESRLKRLDCLRF